MLSFLVRPLTVGTVMGGSFAVESLPPARPVLEVVSPGAVAAVGMVDEFATARAAAAATLVDGSGGTTSPAGDGRASLLAAQERQARSANEVSTLEDEYLLNTVRCIS